MARTADKRLYRGSGAGRLREAVTIEQPTETPNSSGQDEPAWSTWAERRAAVEQLRGGGKEVHDEYQRRAVFPWFVRLRNDSKTRCIEPQWRVMWGSVVLHIEQVNFRGAEVQIVATQDMEV